MKNLALVLATAFAALAGVNTASAQSVSWSGSWSIQNSTPQAVFQTANTYPAGTISGLPASIAAGGFGFPNMTRTTTGTVWSNSFSYQQNTNPGGTGTATGPGCIFTVLGSYTRRTGRYSYTFSSTPAITGQTEQCSHTGSWNSTTGNFTAFATLLP
jgi:hypothetical protein